MRLRLESNFETARDHSRPIYRPNQSATSSTVNIEDYGSIQNGANFQNRVFVTLIKGTVSQPVKQMPFASLFFQK